MATPFMAACCCESSQRSSLELLVTARTFDDGGQMIEIVDSDVDGVNVEEVGSCAVANIGIRTTSGRIPLL